MDRAIEFWVCKGMGNPLAELQSITANDYPSAKMMPGGGTDNGILTLETRIHLTSRFSGDGPFPQGLKPASFLAPDGAAGSPAFSRPFVRWELELNLGEHVIDGALFRLAFVFFELGLKLFFGLVGVEQKFLAGAKRQPAHIAIGGAWGCADEPDDDELAVGHCSSWQGENSESNSG